MQTMKPLAVERFSYTKEQCEAAYGFLDHNEWDLVKVFDIVWRERIFCEAEIHQAGNVLGILEKIKAYRTIHGRSFERIWTAMTGHGDGTYDRFTMDIPNRMKK